MTIRLSPDFPISGHHVQRAGMLARRIHTSMSLG
jgi:hypothetical protein